MGKCGVYIIKSISDQEKYYIGASCSLHKRKIHHYSDLRLNKHHSLKMQMHYNEYGESDLEFSIIIECTTNELNEKELWYIENLNPYFNTVFIEKGKNKSINRYKTVFSEEHKKKLSKASLGVKKSKEHVENMPTKFKKGRIYTDEERKKLSIAQTKRWERDRHLAREISLKAWKTRRANKLKK